MTPIRLLGGRCIMTSATTEFSSQKVTDLVFCFSDAPNIKISMLTRKQTLSEGLTTDKLTSISLTNGPSARPSEPRCAYPGPPQLLPGLEQRLSAHCAVSGENQQRSYPTPSLTRKFMTVCAESSSDSDAESSGDDYEYGTPDDWVYAQAEQSRV